MEGATLEEAVVGWGVAGRWTDGRPHLVRGDLRLASEAHLVVTLTLTLKANVEAMAVALAAALVLIETSMVLPRP